MRFRIVTRDFDKDGIQLGEETVEEEDCALLEPYAIWCSVPMIRQVKVSMVGDNYVRVDIEKVID